MKSRILVVEDEKAIQIALKGLLTREGYEVEQADSGDNGNRDTGGDEAILDGGGAGLVIDEVANERCHEISPLDGLPRVVSGLIIRFVSHVDKRLKFAVTS